MASSRYLDRPDDCILIPDLNSVVLVLAFAILIVIEVLSLWFYLPDE